MQGRKGAILDDMEHASAAAVIDVHGIVTGWSEGARRLTGYPAEEAVGRAARDLLAEDPPPGVVAARTGTFVLRHRDGTRIALPLRACAVVGAAGEPDGFVITAEQPGGAEPTLAGQAFQQASMSMSVFDTEQRYQRLNGVACEVMGVPEEALLGRFFPETVEEAEHSRGFNWHLKRVAETGRPLHYESYTRPPSGDRYHAWNIEMWPVQDFTEEVVGVALAAFDSTEQHWARQRLVLLNEAAAGIGTTLDVVRTAEELVGLLVPRFADFADVDLLDWVLGADEPPAAPPEDVVLRRVAHGSVTESTPEAAVHLGAADVYPPYSPPARALREGRAVLSRAGEPDFERWVRERNERAPRGRPCREGAHSLLAVPLRARGTSLGVAVAVRIAHQDPYAADDAVLAEELASRAAVCIDNARRFARERTTALALQHSLLPRGLPGQAAVEVAHRYLPSGSLAGIGGDWFDVIPLSGSRVALVVGDVVGHGIPSSATMGRLCTAVRTLADVDLPPDELLTHLDDLVIHLSAEEAGTESPAESAGGIGTTCLYAVYDPVSRRCTLARAGHPPPAVVTPDGAVHFLDVPAGPPLGLGGLPFETFETELPEGSLIALYTDGLLEARDHDIDEALDKMFQALARPAKTLDTVCDRILTSMLTHRPDDDIALLIARTRALHADRVATWDLPSDPAIVAQARQHATTQLTTWRLDDAAFITELIVSELVTNAIRYGRPPIQLRLIHENTTLTCEVFDSSSTAPHMRRARTTDEGGRGLLLIGQLAQRWGTRHTPTGKTVWAEQFLTTN